MRRGTRLRYLAYLAVVTALGCGPGQSGPPDAGPAETGPGAAPLVLFDGATLDGWTHAGPGEFEVVGGLLQTRGGLGLLWYSAREFGDFLLELDWRVTASTDNSGVFVRFPDPGGDPFVAVDRGYEIQINDNPGGDPQKTGAVYGFQAATARASRPVGQWNHYAIQAVGGNYTVRLNGVLVNQFAGIDPNRAGRGYLGLQNHDPGSTVQFRAIRVTASGS